MTEPRAARTAEVAVSGHDALLATKLHLPRPRPGFVPRPRLAARLDEGLVLVCAPAGYGKTVAWPTGPAAAGGQWIGCRWMPPRTWQVLEYGR